LARKLLFISLALLTQKDKHMVALTEEEILIGLKNIGINSPSKLKSYLKEYEKNYIVTQSSDSASQKNLLNSSEKEDTFLSQNKP